MLPRLRDALSLLRSVCCMVPLLALITTGMGALSMLSSLFDSTGSLQHRVARAWGRMLMAVFLVPVRVRGAEGLTPGQTYVFASNHFSLIDTPLMFGFMPLPFRILARAGLWKIPFIGWHLDRAGHLPVNRQNRRKAAANISHAAEKVRAGRSILVFPEGGRRRGRTMRRFKTGAAHIAIKSAVPLVPVAIHGTGHVLPPGSLHLRPGTVELRIGAPIPTDSAAIRDARALTDRLRAKIERLAERGAACRPGHQGEESQ